MGIYGSPSLEFPAELDFAVIDMTNGNIQTAYRKNALLLEKDLSDIAIKSIVFKKGGSVKKEERTQAPNWIDYLITRYSWLPDYISDWETWVADIPDSTVARKQIVPSDLSSEERSRVASIDEKLLSTDVSFDPLLTKFIEWLEQNRI